MERFTLHAVAAVAIAASAAASAQETSSATLEVDRGVVMTSRGGEFVTAHSGQALSVGERLMVSRDAAATVVYGDCRQTYSSPGVYTVGESCKTVAAAGFGAGSGSVAASASTSAFAGAGFGGTAAFVAAGAVAAGVIAHNISDNGDNETPISR